MPEAAVR